MAYDDGKYGVIQRHWFGRPLTKGGDAAAGIAISGTATSQNPVKRWYPKGPIQVEKIGAQVIATLASAANATGSATRARVMIKFYKSTSSTLRNTNIGSCHVVLGDTGRTALWGIASLSGSNLASQHIEAGNAITIHLGSGHNSSGDVPAAIGTLVRTGTLAYFIDYRPKFDGGAKWDMS